MRIRTRIWLNLASLLSVLAIIAALAGFFLYDLRAALQRSNDYDQIILKAFALSTLVDDYQLKPGQRTERQLRQVMSSLGILLAHINTNAVEDAFLIEQIKKNDHQLGQLLDQFVSEQSNPFALEEDEPQKILATQIRIKVRYITDDVGQLMHLNQVRMSAKQKGASIAFYILVGLLALTCTLAFMLVNRRIMTGIRELKHGSDLFADRELDHRIVLPGRDELSELAQASNHMAEELQKSYDSLNHHALKLEQSNRELEQFAYVASHDLQEPLRKIQAFGSLVRRDIEDSLSEKGKDYLLRMENAAKRMRDLIDALLSYSRLMRQNKPFTSVDLNTVLKEVLGDLESRIAETRGRIDSAPLPTVEAEPIQMRQLFQNLLSNALKYRRKEVPPQVSITSYCDGNGQGAMCRIEFTDNGIGFEQEYADQIFAPFQRLHGRQEYEGTGIGLAVCRMIIERHGGRISATSSPNQGSTFIVDLPVMHMTKDTEASDPSPQQPDPNDSTRSTAV